MIGILKAYSRNSAVVVKVCLVLTGMHIKEIFTMWMLEENVRNSALASKDCSIDSVNTILGRFS